MGSPCLFTRQRGVNSKPPHTELSLSYLKDTKFYLESKASFIDISSIAYIYLKTSEQRTITPGNIFLLE